MATTDVSQRATQKRKRIFSGGRELEKAKQKHDFNSIAFALASFVQHALDLYRVRSFYCFVYAFVLELVCTFRFVCVLCPTRGTVHPTKFQYNQKQLKFMKLLSHFIHSNTPHFHKLCVVNGRAQKRNDTYTKSPQTNVIKKTETRIRKTKKGIDFDFGCCCCIFSTCDSAVVCCSSGKRMEDNGEKL